MKILRLLLKPALPFLLIILCGVISNAQGSRMGGAVATTSGTTALVPIISHTSTNSTNGVITVFYYFEIHTRSLIGQTYIVQWDNIRSHFGANTLRRVRFQLMPQKCKAFAYLGYGGPTNANNTPYHSSSVTISGSTNTGPMHTGNSTSNINRFIFTLPVAVQPGGSGGTGGGSGLQTKPLGEDDIIVDLVDTYEPGEDDCPGLEIADIDVENAEVYPGIVVTGNPDEELEDTQDEECFGGSPRLSGANMIAQKLTTTNAFSESLLIPGSSITENGFAVILNLNGQILARKAVQFDSQSIFDLSHLPAGTYILRIQSSKGIQSQMIFKQKP